jgi:hypothetical protein
MSILAHEVGHHLNGHTLLGTGSTPNLELEADEFSGFVMRKLGASLAEAQAAIKLIGSERASKTHPGRAQRLASILHGWDHADTQIASAVNPTSQKTKPTTKTKESKLPQKNETVRVVGYEFPEKYILANVAFYALPEQVFYITVKNNFVRITKEGYQVMGKVVGSSGQFYLMLDKKVSFTINNNGYLINSSNKTIGHIAKPSRS